MLFHKEKKTKILRTFILVFGLMVLLLPILVLLQNQKQSTDIRSKAAPATINAPIQGTFVEVDSLTSNQEIQKQIKNIADLGISTIIIQSSKYFTACPGDVLWTNNFPDKIEPLLTEAKKYGMQVWWGLLYSTKNKCYSNDKSLLPLIETHTKQIVTTVLEKASTTQTQSLLAGWYIPDEPGLATFTFKEQQYYMVKKEVQAVKELSSLPIMASPYLVALPERSPEWVVENTKKYVNYTGISLLNWQDGVGSWQVQLWTGKYKARDYYNALINEFGKSRIWADVELFSYGTKANFNGPFYKPASIIRLAEQFEQAKNTGKITVWIQQHHMQNIMKWSYQSMANRLHDAYKALYGINTNKSYITPVSYQWITSPSTTYPDINNTELTDKKVGTTLSPTSQLWVGFTLPQVKVKLNFPENTVIDWVAFHTLSNKQYEINIPKQLILTCTVNGSDILSITTNSRIDNEEGEYVISNDFPLFWKCDSITATLTSSKSFGSVFLSEVEIVGSKKSNALQFFYSK